MAQKTRVTNGAEIFSRRELLGLTQKDLAGRVGISASYLCRIETGVEKPGLSSQTVHRLARELGASPTEITRPAVEVPA